MPNFSTMPIKRKTTAKKAAPKKAAPLGPKAKLMKLQVTTLRNKAKKLGVKDITKKSKETLAQSIILAEARKKRGTAAGKKATAKRKAVRSTNPNRQINVPAKGSTSYWADASREALAPGRRVSKAGNVYYERRANRSDVPGSFAGSKKQMGMVYENDLAYMGKAEIDKLIALLTQYIYGKVTPVFESLWDDDGVGFGYNSQSGNVWLQNADYMAAMSNDGKLDIFLTTPYYGHEGFLDELAPEKDTATWTDEDVQYLYDIYSQLPDSAYKRKLSRYFI